MRRSKAKVALMLSLLGATAAACNGDKAGNGTDGNAAMTASAEPACNRDCLIKATDTYLSALAEHDPKAAPLADGLVFVENVKRMKPGEGLWKTAGGKTQFAIYVPDVDQQQAGWLGVVQQEGKPVMLALRLKLDGSGKITEAEHIIAPPARGNLENVQTVRPGLLATIPDGQRKSHDELIRIGASYYDALDDNDGSKMPFAADCQRRENGITTAGEGAMGPPNADKKAAPFAKDCKGQMDSQSFVYIDRIENRRMVAADPVTGLAMGFSHFRHPMTNLPYTVKHVDGSTSERNAKNMPYKPFDMPAAHIFKIGADGQVHEIEAVGFTAPYNSPTGWE